MRKGGIILALFAGRREMKQYNVIYADPPWEYKTYSSKGKGRSAERHYPTMTLEQIKALPVADIAADDCTLFMWTRKKARSAIRLFRHDIFHPISSLKLTSIFFASVSASALSLRNSSWSDANFSAKSSSPSSVSATPT